jgi:hypothetical protein
VRPVTLRSMSMHFRALRDGLLSFEMSISCGVMDGRDVAPRSLRRQSRGGQARGFDPSGAAWRNAFSARRPNWRDLLSLAPWRRCRRRSTALHQVQRRGTAGGRAAACSQVHIGAGVGTTCARIGPTATQLMYHAPTHQREGARPIATAAQTQRSFESPSTAAPAASLWSGTPAAAGS